MLIVGERYRDKLQNGLQTYKQSVFWLPDNPDMDPRLAGHADLSVLKVDEHTLAVAEGVHPYIVNVLTKRGYTVIKSSRQGKKYPQDAGLCVCRTGQYVIYNPKTVDPVVLPLLGGKRIEVSQGYTKCSVCTVSDEAIITADRVIADKAKLAGLDVLQIEPGHIALDGFDYGFIGGAVCRLDQNTLAFTGTLESHPNGEQILRFLQKHAIQAVFLTGEPIFDIGGAISV
ncbi:MAG: DUF6873 family GME fold protein [Oscillospiraceae bacterium]